TTVEQQQRYLVSRNFRLLATLAGQTENVLSNNARVIRNRLGTPREGISMSEWMSAARFGPRTRGIEVAASEGDVSATAVKDELERYAVSVSGRGSLLSYTWRHPEASAQLPEFSATVPAETVLGPIFTPKLGQGAFDTLLLSTAEGQVVFATGRRQQEFQAV